MKPKEPPPHKCDICSWRRVLSYKPKNERLCQDCYDATKGNIRFNPQYCQGDFIEKEKGWVEKFWRWFFK